MDSSYSILQNERNRKNKQKSIFITICLLLVLIGLILMFLHTFYVAPYQNRIAEQRKIEEKYYATFNGFNVEKIEFGNASYTIKQGTQYYIYDHNINLVFKVEHYDEKKLKEVLLKNKIEALSIKVGIGYDKPALFVEGNNQKRYVFDYENYELIYYGE